jgi:hypothetical protein
LESGLLEDEETDGKVTWKWISGSFMCTSSQAMYRLAELGFIKDFKHLKI